MLAAGCGPGFVANAIAWLVRAMAPLLVVTQASLLATMQSIVPLVAFTAMLAIVLALVLVGRRGGEP